MVFARGSRISGWGGFLRYFFWKFRVRTSWVYLAGEGIRNCNLFLLLLVVLLQFPRRSAGTFFGYFLSCFQGRAFAIAGAPKLQVLNVRLKTIGFDTLLGAKEPPKRVPKLLVHQNCEF